jgi:DNA-binding Lrp family transcriptional regulator
MHDLTVKVFSFKTRVALRALSENARASISDIAQKAKCSRITAAKEVRKLVEDYDVRFRVEVDEDALGMVQRHLLLVKLTGKPKLDDLVETFRKDPYANNVYLCEGDFNLIIHAISSDPMKYIMWESLLPGKLGDYGVNIYPSELMHTNFGYFPVTDVAMSKFAVNVDEKDRNILAALARDSDKSVSGLAEELGMNRTTLYYRMFMLEKRGMIKRFTVSVNRPPMDYMLAYAVNYRFNKTSSTRSVKMMEYYKGYDESLPLMTTFQLLAPMSGSFRFLGMGLFENRAAANKGAIAAHREIFNQEEVDMKTARITGLVKGSYPFRNLDIVNDYTRFKWSEEDLK